MRSSDSRDRGRPRFHGSAQRGPGEVNSFGREPYSTRSATPKRRRGVKMTTSAIEDQKVVSEAEWLPARLALLAKEKELTRARDAVSEERRKLPWVKVEKEYLFDTVDGPQNLSELFAGRSQLIVYHFMWRHDLGAGCVGCSFLCDH